MLAYEGFTEKEAFGVIRKGVVGQGVTVKSREHQRMFNRLERDLVRLARSYEYALDNGMTFYCDLCGRELEPKEMGDGPWHFHRDCRVRLLDFLEKEKQEGQV